MTDIATPSSAPSPSPWSDPKVRLRRILLLALPIVGGMVSQNIMNLVDTAMVGTLGDAALAAVGLGGFANFMVMALLLGLSTGVQAVAARRKGEGKFDEMAVPLNGGLLVLLCVAPPMSALVYWGVPAIYPYLNGDPEVIAHGVPYLQARVLAAFFMGANFAFRGYWNAVDLPRLYMGTLVTMHATNIFLNWVLIFGNLGAPALGVEGAGIASALSTVVGFSCYIWLGFRHARPAGFLQRAPHRAQVATLLRLALPTGIQQLFFAAGFVMTFWIIGQVGTREMAAATVILNLTLVALLPGLGLGIAASTLVGQALGRGDAEDASRWAWEVARVGMIALAVLGLPGVLWPELLLGVFIHDPETMAIATFPMRLVGLGMAVEGLGMVMMHALLGAGDNKRVMKIAVVAQWGVFLPLAYLVGPVLGFGLSVIWCLQVGYRAGMAGVFTLFWMRKGWAGIRV
ncbi:MAG TPA: MATE family efflux transporter [Gammaproteobacteria bacterium]|nr:MATE family efflux transporter [Gammaproteobacteria bacterium]